MLALVDYGKEVFRISEIYEYIIIPSVFEDNELCQGRGTATDRPPSSPSTMIVHSVNVYFATAIEIENVLLLSTCIVFPSPPRTIRMCESKVFYHIMPFTFSNDGLDVVEWNVFIVSGCSNG